MEAVAIAEEEAFPWTPLIGETAADETAEPAVAPYIVLVP